MRGLVAVGDGLAMRADFAPSRLFLAYNTWHRPSHQFRIPDGIRSILEQRRQEEKRIAPLEFQPPPPVPMKRKQSSLRSGLIAVKAGMTHDWDSHGVQVPLTVLFVDDCQVTGIKSQEKHGYWAMQLGAGSLKAKSASLSHAGLFLARGLPIKREVAEFKVSPDALLPVGHQLSAGHFVAGQLVDVKGITKDKGFAGVMKRHGFSGLPASHGVSLTHRSPGSIGNRKSPGKVWKGKKLPGHMGAEHRTVHNVLVFKVDPARNLVYVKGQVPGTIGQFVHLRDAINVQRDEQMAWPLPFPTFLEDPMSSSPSVYTFPRDPYRAYKEEGADYQGVKWSKGE
jgi:large subunit ribosomal protein L3